MSTQRHKEKREHPSPIAPLFICFFLPLGLSYVNWASQECCLVYLRSSLWSLGLPLTFLCSIFASFSLPWLFSSDQSLSRVRLFVTPWIAARQASLSITNSQSSLRLKSIEAVMPSSHHILCRPLLLPPSILPSIRFFSNESILRMRWPKYWSFSLSISPSNEHPGLISIRMDWLDLLAFQGTLKSLL